MSNEKTIEVKIRRATPKDFVNIMSLLEQSVQENEIAYPPISVMKLMQWIVDTKQGGEIIVADISGRIVGVLGLLVQEWKWSEEKFITNEFFFVLPKFRARGTADALLKSAEKFSAESGLRMMIGFSGGRKAEIKDRMMQMRGYIYAGGLFCRLPPKG